MIKHNILFIDRSDYEGRKIHRIIPNLQQILKELQERLDNVHGSKWNIEPLRLEKFDDFHSQVEAITSASVLVGVHGAGMTYSLFLPEHAHIIEIFYGDRGSGNRQFHNIAHWLGLKYHETAYAGLENTEVDVDLIWKHLSKAVQEFE